MTRTDHMMLLLIVTAFYIVFLDATVIILHLFLNFVLEFVKYLCHITHNKKTRMNYGN